MATIDSVKQHRNEDEFLCYRKLFRSVLAQAVHDAFIYVPKTKRGRFDRDYAINFLKGGDGLRDVCEFAEVSYDRIVNAMKELTHDGKVDYKKIMDILKKMY